MMHYKKLGFALRLDRGTGKKAPTRDRDGGRGLVRVAA